MSAELKFEVSSLLTEEGKSVTGPMSPLLFAKEVCQEMETKFNRLARVHFDDQKIFQIYEGEPRSLTGHDILLIGRQYKNDLELSLWVDIGVGGLPVATCFQSDREIIFASIYEQKEKEFARALTTDELLQVFNYVFNNPHVINIKKAPGQKLPKSKGRRF